MNTSADAPFEPTEHDIRHLAIAMLAGAQDCSFNEAAKRFGRMSKGQQDKCLRASRAAFAHPGYLPSIVSQRRDMNQQARQIARETSEKENPMWAQYLAAKRRITELSAENDALKAQVAAFTASSPPASDTPLPERRPDGTLKPASKPWSASVPNSDPRRIGG